MVKDTGKTLRADTYRTVNAPQSVEVEEDASGLPLAVKMPAVSNSSVKTPPRRIIKKPMRQVVSGIDERWRIDDEWWRREPVSRLYYSVRLASGHRLVLYKDLVNNCWYRQSY